MSWPSAADLESLVTRFHARTLPKTEWTHAAHLAVGTWQVHEEGPERALVTLRTGIRLLNDAHGTANSDSGGYHETITRAYLVLIAEYLERAGATDRAIAWQIQALLTSALGSREALLAFYSKSRLFSVEARRGWVEPDQAQLSLDTLFAVASPHLPPDHRSNHDARAARIDSRIVAAGGGATRTTR